MEKKFVNLIRSTYRGIITEQEAPQLGAPTPAPAAGPVLPSPPAPPAAAAAAGETSIEPVGARSSSDAFLIGMVAKALLIDINDDDKLKIIKYLKSLNIDTASKIEENLINMINALDYQNLDIDLDDSLKVSPKKSRKLLKVLDSIMTNYIDTGADKSSAS